MKHIRKLQANDKASHQNTTFKPEYINYINNKEENDIMNNTKNNTVNDTMNDNVYWMITAEDILSSLFDPDEEVCFRIVADKKGDPFSGCKKACICAKYPEMENYLKKQNNLNRGIFFLVNYGGQMDTEITRINAQFVDTDKGSLEEQMEKIQDFPLPPSMVVKTQKSLHAYWFMDRSAKVERFRTIQKQLVIQFDGDPTCENESRAMRLPGFYHNKTDTPVMVECISFHPEWRYTQEQLAKVLPEIIEEKPAKVVQEGKEKGLMVVMESCDFIKHCKEDAKKLSEADWYAMITNLATFEGGADMIQQLSAPYPGYNKDATTRKINHFLQSGTKPMTCQIISEKCGYKCPKLESGECQVKAPAALCKKPLDIDTLVEIIDSLPVNHQTVYNYKTAEEFVKTYLFNVDSGIAEALICDNIAGHFDLKGTNLSDIKKAYRSEHKANEAATKAGKTQEQGNLPEWYSVTKDGERMSFFPGILAKHMADNEHVFFTAGRYYCYEDGVYKEMPIETAKRMIQEKMIEKEATMSQINDAEEQWRIRVQKDVEEINPDDYLINLKNGIYNIVDGTLSAHTPKYLSTIQLCANYDENADCPRFKKFLLDSVGEEQARLIQELMGYFLVPVTSAQKSFIIVGEGGAGKSVLLNTISYLLGEQNVSNISWQELENSRFRVAELFSKLANVFADLPTKNIDDSGMFKSLVGEDSITAERKYQNPFKFRNRAKLLFSCNNIPKNYSDRSDGFYRRLIIIRFPHAVPEKDRDPKLLDKLCEEMDGIFMFALEGLRRLMANDFKFSETEVNKNELQRYKEESDSVLAFVRDCCELLPTSGVYETSTKLYDAYKDYCDDERMKACAHKEFSSRLKAECGVDLGKDSTGRMRVIKGIKLV